MVGQATMDHGPSVLPAKRGADGQPRSAAQEAGDPEGARSVEPSAKNGAVTISFDEVETEGIKLLEVSSDDMLQCLKDGGAVIKASDLADKVVLCTQERTYSVKSVETSNSVFLVENGSSDAFAAPAGLARVDGDENGGAPGGTPGPMTQMAKATRAIDESAEEGKASREVKVCAIANENWEMEQIAPDFKRLDELLRDCQESGCDAATLEAGEGAAAASDDGNDPAGLVGYTVEELLLEVQASETELVEELHRRGDAMQVGDKWVPLSEASTSALLDVLASKVSENGWAWESLPMAQVLRAMEEEEFRKEATLHCVRTLGSAPMFLGSVTPDTKGRVDARKLCVHYARRLLGRKNYNKAEAFMEDWRNTVPVGLEVSVDMLSGFGLANDAGGITFLDNLPRDPKLRFDVLFAERARWLAADMRPFVEGITTPPGKQIDDVLLEHCHGYRPQGKSENPLMYVQKHF